MKVPFPNNIRLSHRFSSPRGGALRHSLEGRFANGDLFRARA